MKLSLGFSPCPNDTFIFDAMIHKKIDTEGLDFEVIMEDVEQLNQKAFSGDLDITKLSYHAFAFVLDQYALLQSGSALGNNCGPLLIAKRQLSDDEIKTAKIAIPGKFTTANFLLNLAFPDHKNKVELLFSEIENAVLDEQVDAGLIIHENRFTYESKGLVKILDLGEFWESTTQLPIPLGGIVVKRSFPVFIQKKINRVLKRSVRFALKNPDQTLDFVSQYAQEMNSEVMFQHINLYVNNYTVDLGQIGKKAVQELFDTANKKGIIQSKSKNIFISEF
jgi:5,8-dihydroxy-2-naphthoate synthase